MGSQQGLITSARSLQQVSNLKPEAWIKWGEHTYCYEINEVVAFKALALFLDTESLGKAGNFIKKNGVVTWSDSPTCEVVA